MPAQVFVLVRKTKPNAMVYICHAVERSPNYSNTYYIWHVYFALATSQSHPP